MIKKILLEQVYIDREDMKDDTGHRRFSIETKVN